MQAHSVAITLLSLSSWMCCWKCIRINLSGILIERGSGSWLAMSTTGTFLFLWKILASLEKSLHSFPERIFSRLLADEESSVGARAPLSASVWSKSSKSHRSEWSCAPATSSTEFGYFYVPKNGFFGMRKDQATDERLALKRIPFIALAYI